MKNWKDFWSQKVLGIEKFKLNFYFKKFLYKFFKISLPKYKSQNEYWQKRGTVYMNEFFDSKYEKREIFFQDLLLNNIKDLKFDSAFEAGCGFGWNINRLKNEFPEKKIGGLDFSNTQLENAKNYCSKEIEFFKGDICDMPIKDNYFDLGFSVGVFMNIHPSKIEIAVDEILRVSKKYVVHLEYDENHAEKLLSENRKFKNNIISYDYKKLYEKKNVRIKKFYNFKDFLNEYNIFMKNLNDKLETWEDWEGPSKYILIVVEKVI